MTTKKLKVIVNFYLEKRFILKMHINEIVVRKLFYGFNHSSVCGHDVENDVVGFYCGEDGDDPQESINIFGEGVDLPEEW